MPDLDKQIISAAKWSTTTEIIAKLVTPITSILLARILTPESFGIMVTSVMVISFAEIFTDAGFQKYLIQHIFSSDDELYEFTTVAFWSNLFLSLLMWAGIICFSEEIATLVGNEGRGDIIVVSCICIPLAAFSSIQMALYKRSLDFQTLFETRMVGVFLPVIITVPLAYITRSYWSLIIGMIALNMSNAIILTVKSKWKPKLFYNFDILKKMFSFTVWSMFESVSIWMTNYMDVFIVGSVLSQHYLGVYRISMTTVGQIMGLIIAATTPILFSSLSKLQNDNDAYRHLFLSFQKTVGIFVMPLGFGIYLYSDLITDILLGIQWREAAHFVGLWGLTSSITVVLSHYSSEVFRSKGYPQLSTMSQIIHLLFLIPTVYWAAGYGFEFLTEMRALVRCQFIITPPLITYFLIKISPLEMIRNIFPSIFSAACMTVVTLYCMSVYKADGLFIQLVYVLLSVMVYLAILFLFPKERHIVLNLKNYIKQ